MVFLNLSCRNCGAPLKPPTESTATCTFCGSSYFIPHSDPLANLRDLEAQALSISSFTPRLKKEGATAIIVSAIKRTESGFQNPESLHMKYYAAHFPVWSLDVVADCHWQGQYSEQRKVTKYREVGRPSAGGSRMVVEPYTETETIWHPQSGTHSFTRLVHVPAIGGMSSAQLKIALKSAGLPGDCASPPRPESGMEIIPPSRSQQTSWDEDGYAEKFQSLAHAECKKLTEHLTHCSVMPRIRQSALMFVPLAEVSYEANSSEYFHCLNLCTGHYSGDLPLDEINVQKECQVAGALQRKISSLRWVALMIATPLLVALACHGPAITPTERLNLSAVLGMLLLLCQPWRSPWADFLWKKRGHFARLLSSPPENIRHQMFAKVSPEVMSLQSSLHEALQDNTLDSIHREKLLPALKHAGTVLLASVGASPAMRMPLAAQFIFPLCLGLAAYYLKSGQPLLPRSSNHHLASMLPEIRAASPKAPSAAIKPLSASQEEPQSRNPTPDLQEKSAERETSLRVEEHARLSSTNTAVSSLDRMLFRNSPTPPPAPTSSSFPSEIKPEPATHKPDEKLSSQERFNIWLQEDRRQKELFKRRFNSQTSQPVLQNNQ